MKYELQVEYIDRKTNERKPLGRIERETKEEILDFILETQSVMKSEFYYPEYTLWEKI